jgi:hypothetical protein
LAKWDLEIFGIVVPEDHYLHVIGDISVPSALALAAQTRDKLLAVAEPFSPVMVEGELVNLDLLRETTKQLKPEERLAMPWNCSARRVFFGTVSCRCVRRERRTGRGDASGRSNLAESFS